MYTTWQNVKRLGCNPSKLASTSVSGDFVKSAAQRRRDDSETLPVELHANTIPSQPATPEQCPPVSCSHTLCGVLLFL